ncbi:class E basic helix-loop-helix protein 40 [Austrofundulus limnaeus]|uniref:Class E basic helix-loop-helix protein 40 n=1 Tax=Austrofundulus limnaeus TaxID=52670 RepID=A0A2I4CBR2_AUSLI|nr:PREDICTED: class E basic helix-loop-helix protein 40-like [Austrofundulus limnaeus]
MERITSAQPPPYAPKHPSMDITDMHRLDFPIYMCKSRRGAKRGDECKETYKLPHRLIEKKRRDRINECISQLKDLLPEHLKLTTLGHLEKAVVLELTLKHMKSQNTVLEQQQQTILALQKDLRFGDRGGDGAESSEEIFRSGFQLCMKEVVHYLASQEMSRDPSPSGFISHIQKVAAEMFHHPSGLRPDEPALQGSEKVKKPIGPPAVSSEAPAKNCVPVIQRTYQHGAGEQSGSDTDTDSGYGGEHDKPKALWSENYRREGDLKAPAAERTAGVIKQEGDEPRVKRSRADSPEDEVPSVHEVAAPGSYMSFAPNQPPFCLPFYLIPPSAAAAASAAYLPMLDKCWYPGGVPVMYPGMRGSAVSLAPESLPPSLVMSPRPGSPVPHHTLVDPPSVHKALRQVCPLNLETKN